MADIKISQLGAGVSASDSQVVPAVDNGSTIKLTLALIKDYITGGLTNLKTSVKTSVVAAINEVFDLAQPLAVSQSSVSALPVTISSGDITANMVCKPGDCYLSNPAAQTGEWTVTTAAGSVTISGTISGTTDITLWLTTPRTTS